jgi:hypothetical protein
LFDRRWDGMCESLGDSYCLIEDSKVCISF